MSNEKFTPGPWVVIKLFRQKTGALAIVHDPSGDTVTICDVIDDKEHPEIADADAALIAATPEMYEALTQMCEMWQSMAGQIHPLANEQKYLNALEVIKKARGEK